MACDRNGVVGKSGAIPWRYPDEFKHFRNTIGNHPIIIGRKSFELIPKSTLDNRVSIVFSRQRCIPKQSIIPATSRIRGFFMHRQMVKGKYEEKFLDPRFRGDDMGSGDDVSGEGDANGGNDVDSGDDVNSRNERNNGADGDTYMESSEVIFVSSLEDFLSLDILKKEKKIFMVGGAQLANYFLEHNLVFEFILTIIKDLYEGDAILDIKALNVWQKKVINKTSNYDIYKLTP